MKDSKSILDMKKEAIGQNQANAGGAGSVAGTESGYSLYTLAVVSILAFLLG